ncbi:MAG: HlyC/CorC family transporter [Flavipsychrobacter sp.]|nr:HlyC/CorC family transporter [Flavipsychrobacter sp.]
MDTNLIWYIITCIVFIGFFAGTEIAFTSANKLNIELRKKQGSFTARIIARFMERSSEFIGTCLVGLNIALVIYGFLMTSLTEGLLSELIKPYKHPYLRLVLDTLVATLILLIFAYLLPKAIFRAKSEQFLSFFSPVLWLLNKLLSPIATLFVSISEFILKHLFNVRMRDNQQVFSRVNMDTFVRQSLHGHESADPTEVNTELFENALDLVNVKIRKCMVPRNEVIAIELNTPILQAREKFIKTKLSKIVVYDGSIDNIVGYLHQIDLYRKPQSVKDILHTISAIPEAMSAVDLMNQFTRERKSIAWVIDEFGGTAGIVTMEDVLEEIFGDINDEYDVEEYVEQQISENEFIFSGRMEVEYLNEKYGFHFPTDESETLSGYIIANHETIPKIKERIIIDRHEFDILLVSDTRIETVKIKVLR